MEIVVGGAHQATDRQIEAGRGMLPLIVAIGSEGWQIWQESGIVSSLSPGMKTSP
jgi:hypothetical protein